MINVLRTDLRRLFKTRSFYIAMILALALLAIFTTASWFFADNMVSAVGDEQVMGIKAGSLIEQARRQFNVSRFASFFMMGASIMHVLLVVFGAGFISKDHQTGTFKNYLSIPHFREKWLVSKFVTLLVAGVLFYLVIILGSVAATLFFGNKPNIDVVQLLNYFGLHLTADLALFALITLTVAFFQTKTSAVLVAMFFAFNMQTILYVLLDQTGWFSFKLMEYGMMGRAGRLDIMSLGRGSKDLLSTMAHAMGPRLGSPVGPMDLLPVTLGVFAVFFILSWVALSRRDYKG